MVPPGPKNPRNHVQSHFLVDAPRDSTLAEAGLLADNRRFFSAMSSLQQTVARSSSISGSSLHTGEKVTLTLHPAPAGHGRKFRRSDLPDEPTIDAKIEHVKTVERATTIVEGA